MVAGKAFAVRANGLFSILKGELYPKTYGRCGGLYLPNSLGHRNILSVFNQTAVDPNWLKESDNGGTVNRATVRDGLKVFLKKAFSR